MRPKLVLFGDSITEGSFMEGGWGATLAHHFSRTADVVLRGYSGYNTRWARLVVERAMDGVGVGDASPKAVTVFFGANDACLPDRAGASQHVPLLEYQDNLRSICSFFKAQWPTTIIVLITPPPIDEDGRLKNPYENNSSGLPDRTNEFAGAYAKACVAIAKESDLPVIDIWSKMQSFPGWEKSFLSDGLHLTALGNRIVFEEVVLKLKEKGISLEAVPIDLPLFTDIDTDNPHKSLCQ
ncbi:GDSL esterase/lipase At5g45920 isoform X1 [Dioscorea cayenensis subsp. rotundata]|uniref:GDSL esterase/lipase At5g45920 isoform X1 n=1 Tax=Dioscorea cayennensis subsp. rotundata TaxID=55577 RepID=A0AB40B9J8_DIOCR|nr:GDSL esterase/lipase At5g45920 isoform X1 [Dioscorea cayenensis subsp. rotundata]